MEMDRSRRVLGVESGQPKVMSGGTVLSELQMDQRYQIWN